jgi:hypothetical protein
MEHNYILPLVEPANEEATRLAKADKVYEIYINWLKENGCIYPSVLNS